MADARGIRKDQSKREMAKIERRVMQLIRNIEGITPGSLLEVASTILQIAEPKVPFVTGRLFKSGYTAVTSDGKQHVAEVGFGFGGDPDYTIFVHEIIENNHPVGQAKFLQMAVEETMNRIPSIIRKHIKDNTELKSA